MDGSAFESLTYENAAGIQTILSSRSVSSYWELGGRSGFSAPTIELITQKYVNGAEKIIGRIVKPRTVKINMVVTGGSRAKRDALFFDMIAKLMDTSKGETGRLYVTRSDGKTVILNCAYSSGLNVADQYRKLQKFTLEFYASDPYFYASTMPQTVPATDIDVKTLSEDLYLDDSWCLGDGICSGIGQVDNPSDLPVEPVISITGARKTLQITNQTAGWSINLSGMDLAGTDRLVIDAREKSKDIYIVHADGTTESGLQYLDWSVLGFGMPLELNGNTILWSSEGTANPLTFEASQQFLSA